MSKRNIDVAQIYSKGKDYLNNVLRKRSSSTKGETTSNKGKSNKSKSDKEIVDNATIRKRRLGKMDAVGITASVLEATDPIAIARNLAIYGGMRLSEKIGNRIFYPNKGKISQGNSVDEARRKVVEQTVTGGKRANALGTEQGKIFARSSARLQKGYLKRMKEIEKLRKKIEKLEKNGKKLKASDRKRKQLLNRLEFDASDAGRLETFFRKLEHHAGPKRTGTSGPSAKNSDRKGGETKTSERYRHIKELLENNTGTIKDKLIGSIATGAGYIILDQIFGEDSEYAEYLNSPELVESFRILIGDSPKVKEFLDDNVLDTNESAVLEKHLESNKLFDKDTYANYVDKSISIALRKASKRLKSTVESRITSFIPVNKNIVTSSSRPTGKIAIPIKHFVLPGFYTRKQSAVATNKNTLAIRYGITPDEYANVKRLLNVTD